MALTDQLQRRQTEAQRLKVEHKRLSKEKLPVQETALIKQIEVPTRSWSGSPPCRIALITDCFGCQVYDRCITDLRSQLEHDGADPESSVAPSAAPLAVRPLIRQPRASIRTDGEPRSLASASARTDPSSASDASFSSPDKAADFQFISKDRFHPAPPPAPPPAPLILKLELEMNLNYHFFRRNQFG